MTQITKKSRISQIGKIGKISKINTHFKHSIKKTIKYNLKNQVSNKSKLIQKGGVFPHRIYANFLERHENLQYQFDYLSFSTNTINFFRILFIIKKLLYELDLHNKMDFYKELLHFNYELLKIMLNYYNHRILNDGQEITQPERKKLIEILSIIYNKNESEFVRFIFIYSRANIHLSEDDYFNYYDLYANKMLAEPSTSNKKLLYIYSLYLFNLKDHNTQIYDYYYHRASRYIIPLLIKLNEDAKKDISFKLYKCMDIFNNINLAGFNEIVYYRSINFNILDLTRSVLPLKPTILDLYFEVCRIINYAITNLNITYYAIKYEICIKVKKLIPRGMMICVNLLSKFKKRLNCSLMKNKYL